MKPLVVGFEAVRSRTGWPDFRRFASASLSGFESNFQFVRSENIVGVWRLRNYRESGVRKEKRTNAQVRTLELDIWCGRVDSNHHGISTASPSSWCVCQFRHDRAALES